MKEGKARCGGATRDDQGNWKTGFLANLGPCSVDEAEAWGIYYGLKLAWDKGLRKVILECDSKRLVDWLTKDGSRDEIRGPIANLVNRCKTMMGQDREVRMTHVFREQNRVVDHMAKKVSNYDRGLQVFDIPPNA